MLSLTLAEVYTYAEIYTRSVSGEEEPGEPLRAGFEKLKLNLRVRARHKSAKTHGHTAGPAAELNHVRDHATYAICARCLRARQHNQCLNSYVRTPMYGRSIFREG